MSYENGTTYKELAPHSVEAEEAALGAILYDPDVYDTLAGFLTHDSFFILRNAWVWEAMTRLKNRGDFIDNLTVIEELRQQERLEEIGGGAYITYLINNTPTSYHAEVYGRIVQRAYTRRKLLAAATDIAQQATDSDIEAYQAVNNAVALVNDIATTTRRRDENTGVNVGDVAADLLVDFYDPNQSEDMLKTGIPGLDRALGGGYEYGHHMIIAASGTGKTILCGNMAYNFAAVARKKVLYILMESNEKFLTRRMLGYHMGVNPEFLKRKQVPPMPGCMRCGGKSIYEQLQCSCRRGDGYADDFRQRYAAAVEEFSELPIRIVKAVLHLNTWRQTLDSIERDWREKADVVFIDYGQNVALPGNVSLNDGHVRFANELTEMSMNEDRYIFTPLQVKKEGDAGIRRPATQNDINGTSKWFNCADTMITIFRDPLTSNGDNVGMSETGIITMPKLRDSELARPVPVKLYRDGLFFGEVQA